MLFLLKTIFYSEKEKKTAVDFIHFVFQTTQFKSDTNVVKGEIIRRCYIIAS